VEDLEVVGHSRQFWRGKRVLVTGDSGFKGSWLALWLNVLGAEIHGLSLPPDQRRNLYSLAKVGEISKTHFIDIRKASQVRKVVGKIKPQIIFHLAAQPIVRMGYSQAKETWDTNLTGTIHLLEAARKLPSLKVIVVVTTDKVYRNPEKGASFVESDPLGGKDPYSASKAAADLATASYHQGFFQKMGVGVATARAGNVIGGGDWAKDRIVPDAIRAWGKGKSLLVRNPASIRPWQHVLDSLGGYLILAEKLWKNPRLSGAYNFGPETSDRKTVRALIQQASGFSPKGKVVWGSSRAGPVEARVLALNNSKAKKLLGFHPVWEFRAAVARTFDWYASQSKGGNARRLCLEDIQAYEKQALR
jgi:CDP-glucose 4,6-dehydratase